MKLLTKREVRLENEVLIDKIKGIQKHGADVKARIEHNKDETFPVKTEKSLTKSQRLR